MIFHDIPYPKVHVFPMYFYRACKVLGRPDDRDPRSLACQCQELGSVEAMIGSEMNKHSENF